MTARCPTHRSAVKLRAQHNLVQAQAWSAQHGKLHSLETLIPGRSLFLQKKRDALRQGFDALLRIGDHEDVVHEVLGVDAWLECVVGQSDRANGQVRRGMRRIRGSSIGLNDSMRGRGGERRKAANVSAKHVAVKSA